MRSIPIDIQLDIIETFQDFCLEGHKFCDNISHYYIVTERVKEFHDLVSRYPTLGWEKVGLPDFTDTYHQYNDLADYLLQKLARDYRLEDSIRDKESTQALRDRANTFALQMQGRRDMVRRDEYVSKLPSYKLIGLGRDPISHKRVALIRIPRIGVRILVYLSGSISKNILKKVMRDGFVEPNTTTHKLLCNVVDEYRAGVKTPKWTLTDLNTLT